jgi:hypothetical protein
MTWYKNKKIHVQIILFFSNIECIIHIPIFVLNDWLYKDEEGQNYKDLASQ